MRGWWRRLVWAGAGCLAAGMVLSPAVVAAQNVGTGPLTAPLLDNEPTNNAIDVGPLKVAPGFVIPQIGSDSNVYNEHIDPKSDFITQIAPDLSVFSRMRFLKLSAYGGGDFAWFRDHKEESWNGYRVRGRVDLLLSRVRPFAAYGQTKTREPANGEIDSRANRIETERSGGLAIDVGPYSNFYVSAVRTSTEFRDASNDGVDLGQSLSRDTEDYDGGFQTALTPLTTLTVRGGLKRERFHEAVLRNSESPYIQGTFAFAPQAVLSGAMTVGYFNFKPVDPKVLPYHGTSISGAVLIPFLEQGRFNIGILRDLQYSFDEAEAYYIELTGSLQYTQLIHGAWDLNVRGSRSRFDYGHTVDAPARRDRLDLVGAGLGYNLRNRTRIALNYEYSLRRSPELPERNYDRRRLYLSWALAY